MLGLGLAITAGFLMAWQAIVTRMLKQVPMSVILFWYTSSGIILTTIFLIGEMAITGAQHRIFGSYTSRHFLICLGAAMFDSGSLIFLTLAF